MIKKVFAFLIFVSCSGNIFGQESGVEFLVNTNYEEAVQKAAESQKPLMFYFHSDYCYGCVPLDSLLKTDDLSSYLNNNFLSVKIDLEQPIGERLRKKYNIRYLPTLVLENKDEQLVFVLHDNLEPKNIITHGNWTKNPAKHGSAFIEALKKKQKMLNYERVDSIFDFSVVDNYVVEKEDSVTLYNQTILHKFLNDGMVNEHFEKYLATQKDWSKEKNMKFIVDFLDDTRSDAFKYLMNNWEKFTEIFGKEFIDDLIIELINKRLYQLQPQPKYDETMSLMKILDPENSDLRVYDYLIDMKLKTNKIVEYLYLERKYIKKFAPKDHERMIRMAKVYLENVKENYNVDYYIDNAIIANRLNRNNIDYLTTLTKLYIKKGDKSGAATVIIRAFSLANKENIDYSYIVELMHEVDKMYGLFDAE